MITVMDIMSGVLCLAAGGVLFVAIFGRRILGMREGVLKNAVSLGLFFALTALPLALGIWNGPGHWLTVPAAILLGAAVLELNLMLARHRVRAEGPVETEGRGHRWTRPVTTCALAMRRYEVVYPGLPVDRLRVAHVSDVHANDSIPMDWYLLALDHVSFMKPDLFFITGDFVSDARDIPLLGRILPHARAAHGAYGVLGNHDHWVVGEDVAAAVEAAGVTVLGNGSRRVKLGNQKSVLIVGCEEPWHPEAWRAPEATEGWLGLTHTPDNVHTLSDAGALAVFAGHTHGGQLSLPGAGALVVPSFYGRLYSEGHFRVGGTHLFVTTGLGTGAPPLRIFCQPEILIVDFLRERDISSH